MLQHQSPFRAVISLLRHKIRLSSIFTFLMLNKTTAEVNWFPSIINSRAVYFIWQLRMIYPGWRQFTVYGSVHGRRRLNLVHGRRRLNLDTSADRQADRHKETTREFRNFESAILTSWFCKNLSFYIARFFICLAVCMCTTLTFSSLWAYFTLTWSSSYFVPQLVDDQIRQATSTG